MPADQSAKVIEFLNDINTNLQTSDVKKINIVPTVNFIDRDSHLYFVQGAITFRSSLDAARTYSDFITITTVSRNSIEYGTIILTDNTDHYPNPQPDIITNSDTKGVRTNLEKYVLD